MEALHTSVAFESSDDRLSSIFSEAERKCLENIKVFQGRPVLVEGGGYHKIWLETQPMGGEMYGKRNAEIAINNSLLFMENIREDGRLPGSIENLGDKIEAQYNKIQGFCFPRPALSAYYLSGKDREYLDLLEDVLARFDSYLWKYRDSDNDGCLETWCRFDTGEDGTLRLGSDAPNYWIGEDAPKGYSLLPVASMDFMSYSYSSRKTLSEIAAIKKDEEKERFWKMKAEDVSKKIISYLWQGSALYDRDKKHNIIPCLTHNTLRCMYWGSIPLEYGRRFVLSHLLSPDEFWTPFPLPSIAANDSFFRNIEENSWTGQAEALTYQRAITALEDYGFDSLVPILGKKLIDAISPEMKFVQQYDPFTGKPSLSDTQDSYGPALLSVLEYITRLSGISIERERIRWSASEGIEATYTQEWGEDAYRLVSDGKRAECFINGKRILKFEAGSAIITGLDGRVVERRDLTRPQPTSP